MNISAPRTVSLEFVIIIMLALADTASTMWLVGSGLAAEANPIMRFYLERGAPAFIGVRTLMLGPAVMLEWLLPRNPVRIRMYLRSGVIAYFLAYLMGTVAQYERFLP